MERTTEQGSQAGDDGLIFVHGTFAAAADDIGARWWQRESPFWKDIHATLNIGAPELSSSFHWSGSNSETERKAAGLRLAGLLEQLERSKRPYHLVGHSHGGSVIWYALAEVTRLGQSLSWLRSWVTVGTPFFQYVPRPISLWQIATLLILGGLLVASIDQAVEFAKHAGTFIGNQTLGVALTPILLALLWVALLGLLIELAARLLPSTRRNDQAAAQTVLARAWALGSARVLIIATGAIGSFMVWWLGLFPALSFDIKELGQSARGLKVAILPFIWIALLALFVFLIARLTLQLLAHLRFRREKIVLARAARDFGSCHLALWSQSDEAINGLRTTLAAPSRIVPRLRGFSPNRTQFVLEMLSKPLYWLYNELLARASDEFVWNTVVRRLQGNDDSRFLLCDVTTGPSEPPVLASVLTAEDEDALSAAANRQGGALVPSARRALGLAATSYRHGDGVITVLKSEISLEGLVHTTYFSIDSVHKLLTDHILKHMKRNPAVSAAEEAAPYEHRDGATGNSCDCFARSPESHGKLLEMGSSLSVAINLALVSIALIIWVSASALWTAWIYPETDEAIVEDVLRAPPITQASNEPDSSLALASWVEALIWTGQEERATKLFDKINGVEGRVVAMAAAADQLRSVGRTEQANQILEQADWLARSSFNLNEMIDKARDENYADVIRALVHAGKIKEANDFVALVEKGKRATPERISAAIDQLAIGYAAIGRLDDALSAAERVPDHISQLWTYGKILEVFRRPSDMAERDMLETWYASTSKRGVGQWAAGYMGRKLAIAGQFAEAEKWAARLTWDQEKARVLLEIGLSSLPQNAERALQSVELAAALLKDSDHPNFPARPLAAGLLALLGKGEAAERLLMATESAQRPMRDDLRVVQAAIVWLITGATDRARTAVAELGNGISLTRWDRSFDRLLSQLSRVGKDRAVIAAVETWPDNALKAEILSRLGVAALLPDQRTVLLFAAAAVAKDIASGPLLFTVMPELATAWVRIGGSRRARLTCEACAARDRLRIDATLLEKHGSRASGLPAGARRTSLSDPLGAFERP